MQRGFDAREAFCNSVQALVPSNAGQKSVIVDIVKGAVGPVIDAIKAIWMRRQGRRRADAQGDPNPVGGSVVAVIRVHLALRLIIVPRDLIVAENPQNPPQLYDRPVLVVDPGTHTAAISSASADRDGSWAVTGSFDKTVRVWSLPTAGLRARSACPPTRRSWQCLCRCNQSRTAH